MRAEVQDFRRFLAESGIEVDPDRLLNILMNGEGTKGCPDCDQNLGGLCFNCFLKLVKG